MAQQFRRKPALQDPTPDEHQESFVKIGTPLPSLSSTKADQNVFLPIWKQEVTDEQGRRRLHGAFTGGFSAGYFNTVGSKEGWNPAEFKSSRTDKKSQPKSFTQKPEDFMDEEDLAELAQSKELQTNSNFGSSSNNSLRLPRKIYDPLTGAIEGDAESDLLGGQPSRPSAIDIALSDLVQPSNARAGQRIMRKMGWRDGQGIGPRITHEKRLLLASKLGVDLNSQLDLEDDPERKKHLYAPIDRPLRPMQPWPGTSGLGHSTSAPPHYLNEPSSSAPHSSTAAKNQGPTIPKGSSFGLGALNDTEDDDHDVYAPAFDQVTSDPRARRLLNLSEDSTSSHKQPPGRQSTKITKPSTRPGKQVFQDNTPLPKGFRLSDTLKKDPTSTSFVPPQVPEKWKPSPTQIWDAARSHGQPLGVQPNPRQSARPINAHDRARLIGEDAPPKSVFDFISAKDKARLDDAKQLAQASLHSKSLKSEKDDEGVTAGGSITIPKLDPSIAQAALRGFMPFSHDLPKQDRYKLYLQSQAGMLPKGTQFSPKITPQMTAEVINKELDGFVKSAMMFKPMSAMMASRFTSAASSSAGGEMAAPEPGLRQPVFLEEEPEETSTKEKEGEESKEEEVVSDAAQAVRVDMFGMLTRSIKKFYPQKLLCKRFNVPNPFPDGPPAEPIAKTNLAEFLSSQGFQPAATPVNPGALDEPKSETTNLWLQAETKQDAPQPVEQVGLGSDQTQGREILTTSRPPIDLFKAIFADNSDDEDSHDGPDDLAHHGPNEIIPPQASVREDSDPSLNLTRVVDQQVVSLTPVVVDPKAVENLTSFRPTFRIQKDEELSAMNPNETTSSKKATKKKKRPVLISFDEEQADGQLEHPTESKKKKKRKSKTSRGQEEEDNKSHRESLAEDQASRDPSRAKDVWKDQEEDEWVEAAVPIPPPPDPEKPKLIEPHSSKTYKKMTRMKASDMMD
ncbi:hypothetical protein PGT21_017037 [Puccinia graminis f. sp. tritici]|uniref:G-patch domain-containing protein n=1 Tax=Puccinia graminis f. sp. tritici TaxID=56615 RepID=A0A5B0S3M4_PUCGR|nr:hypothetical protein PGT21_017037 [Puccinia graminis f. sp. tritici]KAA1131985.1 hypothetical protein PGTUg99_035279 [Puccinia graminis f. sp. tritici]